MFPPASLLGPVQTSASQAWRNLPRTQLAFLPSFISFWSGRQLLSLKRSKRQCGWRGCIEHRRGGIGGAARLQREESTPRGLKLHCFLYDTRDMEELQAMGFAEHMCRKAVALGLGDNVPAAVTAAQPQRTRQRTRAPPHHHHQAATSSSTNTSSSTLLKMS